MKYWLIYAFTALIILSQQTVTSNSKTKVPKNNASQMAVYDVSLIKSSISGGPIKYGVSVPFNIVVTNEGDMPINNIGVIDYVPSGYTFDMSGNNTIWIPSADVSGAYETTITQTLDPLETATITINLILQPTSDTINWVNEAEVFQFEDTMGTIVSDLDSTNDKVPGDPVSEDDNDVQRVRVYDLALKHELTTPTPYFYNDTLTFTTTIYNQGNEETGNVITKNLVTEGYRYEPSINTVEGWAGPLTGPLNNITGLQPGDSVSFDIHLILVDTSFDAGAWENYAEIFQIRDASNTVVNNNEADSNPNSNTPAELSVKVGDPDDNNINGNGPSVGEDEDDHDPAEARVLDVALKKERSTAVASYSYTQNVEFTVDVINQGNVDIAQYTIVDTIPCGLEYVDIPANAGWVFDASMNSVRFTDDNLLAGNTTRQLSLFLGVNPCYNNPQVAWDNYTEIESVIAADGLGNEDIDGELDAIVGNDTGGTLAEDNEVGGLGPREGADEDNHDIERVDVYDLAIISTITTPGPYTYGQELDFNLEIINQGNVVADSIDIRTIIPQGYIYNQALNAAAGWTIVDDTTLNLLYNEHLGAEESVNVPLKLTVAEADSRLDWVVRNYIFIPRDTLGRNRGDDADSFPFSENVSERAALPGDANDDNIFVLGPPGIGLIEDDSDPAGFFVSDLSLNKSIQNPLASYNEGDPVTFAITVTNEGGNIINSFQITDYLPCGLAFSSTLNSGWVLDNATGYVTFDYNTPLDPGSSITIPITLTVQACTNNSIDNWTNVAEISLMADEDGEMDDFDSDPDDNPNNDPADEDDIDDTTVPIFDLSLMKAVNTNRIYQVGEVVTYTISILNEGNIPADNISIIDYLPCGLELAPTGNTGWSVDLGGNARYTITSTLNPQSSIDVTINLISTSCSSTGSYLNTAEITGATDDSNTPQGDFDSNPDDQLGNDDPDEDDIDEVDIIVESPNGSIGDYVWLDTDGDGIQDSNEQGIAGMPIKLLASTGIVLDTVVSDANGNYLFSDVEAGDYIIIFCPSSELQPTTPNTGNGSNDSNITNTYGINSTAIFTLNEGEDLTTIDGGFFECAKICGSVWYDYVENDFWDNFENGINGLKVRIYRLVNGSYTLWDETETGHKPGTPSDDGYFEFCTNPGTYYVEVVMPPIGLVQVRPNIGGANRDSDLTNAFGLGTTVSFNVGNGGEKCDIRGGFYPMARVGNLVWFDENTNGIQDANETPASGVELRLYNVANEMLDIDITDQNGTYEFDYMQREDYYLEIVPPSGYIFTVYNNGPDDVDSDVTHYNGLNTTSTFRTNPGDNTMNIDAGLTSSVLPVEWLDIQAIADETSNTVIWSVAQEVNLSHYEVMTSKDGKRFERIGNVYSTDKMSYSFRDTKHLKGGIRYYRIRQYDLDGRHTESRIVSVNRSYENEVTLYPIPANHNINIALDQAIELPARLSIYDTEGQHIKEVVIGDRSTSIDISKLSSGLYTGNIYSNGKLIATKKILKIN